MSYPFLWECQPKAAAFLLELFNQACHLNSAIKELERDLYLHTSTNLFDWLDHIIVEASDSLEEELFACGFESEKVMRNYKVYFHPRALFPRIVVSEEKGLGIAVKVEKLTDFIHIRGLGGKIEGAPLSGYCRYLHSVENESSLWIVERRATLTMEPTYPEGSYLEKIFEAKEKWILRGRKALDEDALMARTFKVGEELVKSLGADLAAWIVLESEREYWQLRNFAGQLQKNRQDRLGMGWANHDHHTFRSSRKHFFELVHFFEMLGFHCRERFYAGKEAGWGAQVMENPRCGLVLFLDVDLSPDELEIDFAHHSLSDLEYYGTIGLWCALHGDSIFKAGMHHLEAQFMHDNLTADLKKLGVGMMDPFSSFPHLKQAFTEGEVWSVDPMRVEKILYKGKISKEQAKKFLTYGAVGSHLENLQRCEGYKGFNQKNVSAIIQKTDPRSLFDA